MDFVALGAAILFSTCLLKPFLTWRYLALEHQALVWRRTIRPKLKERDRLFWRLLRHVFPNWRDVCYFVQPATVVKWHRETLFKLFWRWLSRLRGRKPLDARGVELLRQMAKENPHCGPSDFQGKLRKLGYKASINTIKKYLGLLPEPKKPRGRRRSHGPDWMTFLRLHREYIAAMDYFVVYSLGFSPMFVFFVIDHSRRKILHIKVTKTPNYDWVKQQLREAFPYEHGIRYLVHDNDPVFIALRGFMKECLGIQSKRTAFRSPWMNGIAERFVKTIRQELTDHVIPLNERHLCRLVREYCEYYNRDRTHTTLDLDSPEGRPVTEQPFPGAKVVSIPRVRGLHHVYRWETAA
jgi:transposase InsO family protein